MPAVQQRGDGQHPLLVVEDGADDALHGQADGVVGGALALDDAVGGANHVVGDALTLGLVEHAAVKGGAPLGDRHTADLGGGPQGHLGVAVLTGDVAVDVLDGRAGLQGDEVPHPGGVQHRAGAEDLVLGQTGDLLGAVGHHVHRVGHEDEDGVGSDLDQLGEDLLHDADGGASQLEAGLAGLLLGAGGDGDDVRVAADLGVVGARDGAGGGELDSLSDVEGLSLDLLLDDVLQHNLAGNALGHAGVGEGGADGPGTDDSDFGGAAGTVGGVGAFSGSGDVV